MLGLNMLGQKHLSHQQCHDLVGSRLDLQCQHHTSGTIDKSLRVPNLDPGKISQMYWLIVPL